MEFKLKNYKFQSGNVDVVVLILLFQNIQKSIIILAHIRTLKIYRQTKHSIKILSLY